MQRNWRTLVDSIKDHDDGSVSFCVPDVKTLHEALSQYEIETNSRFVCAKSNQQFGSSDFRGKKHTVQWEAGDKTSKNEDGSPAVRERKGPYVPFCGMPFMALEYLRYECHHGRTRKGDSPSTDAGAEIVDHPYKKRKVNLQPTKKLDCPAAVTAVEIVFFPQYRLAENKRTHWHRRNTSKQNKHMEFTNAVVSSTTVGTKRGLLKAGNKRKLRIDSAHEPKRVRFSPAVACLVNGVVESIPLNYLSPADAESVPEPLSTVTISDTCVEMPSNGQSSTVTVLDTSDDVCSTDSVSKATASHASEELTHTEPTSLTPASGMSEVSSSMPAPDKFPKTFQVQIDKLVNDGFSEIACELVVKTLYNASHEMRQSLARYLLTILPPVPENVASAHTVSTLGRFGDGYSKFLPPISSRKALVTSGGRNECLYNALSCIFYWNESKPMQLRLGGVVFGLAHMDLLIKSVTDSYGDGETPRYWAASNTTTSVLKQADKLPLPQVIEFVVTEELHNMCDTNWDSAHVQILAMSGYIRRPIQQHCQDKSFAYDQFRLPISVQHSMLPAVHICWVPFTLPGPAPNHFVPLVERTPEEISSLSNCGCQDLCQGQILVDSLRNGSRSSFRMDLFRRELTSSRRLLKEDAIRLGPLSDAAAEYIIDFIVHQWLLPTERCDCDLDLVTVYLYEICVKAIMDLENVNRNMAERIMMCRA